MGAPGGSWDAGAAGGVLGAVAVIAGTVAEAVPAVVLTGVAAAAPAGVVDRAAEPAGAG